MPFSSAQVRNHIVCRMIPNGPEDDFLQGMSKFSIYELRVLIFIYLPYVLNYVDRRLDREDTTVITQSITSHTPRRQSRCGNSSLFPTKKKKEP